MATKVKIKGIKAVQKSVASQINKAISDEKIYEDAAELLKEEIRSGKNPKTGRAYRSLKSSTIEDRKRKAKLNKTHPEYSPNRSNLTLTGALIDGIFSRFSKSKGILTIDIKGEHPGYKTKSGRTKKVSRKQIVEGLEDQKRPVLTLSNKFLTQIVKRIEERLRRL